MCSISGVFDISVQGSDPRPETLRPIVERMNEALKHRGPDDNGVVGIEAGPGNIWLGNTRLAIIDTSVAGHQPMHDPETGNWITYNGETYNFRELRGEIGEEFGHWSSNTDTEVVLRAYRKWGVEAFAKLRGMFGLAIWDNQKQQLLIARDRFGIKPLYYCFTPGTVTTFRGGSESQTIAARQFLFASEVRALLATDLIPRKLSSAALSSYLEFGSVQAPLSIVDGVQSLMPGQYLTVKESDSSISFEVSSAYFGTSSNGHHVPESRERAKSELRAVLEESIHQHLVSDVPIGVFLSGGMDSSAIVALMSRVSTEPPKTFSVVFNEEKFNESPHSRLVAKKFGTDHCEIKLSEESLLEQLPDAIAALDQPTMDGINTYVVSKAVRNAGVVVALSGLGGDELFAGYPSFRRALKLESTLPLARHTLKAMAPVGELIANGSVQRNKFWQLAKSDGSAADVYRITRQLFAAESAKKLTISNQDPFALATKIASTDHDIVNAVSKLELSGYMANTLLRDTDSMSMAHSLEVRVPFVDSFVADYVLQLPGEWKLSRNNGKGPKPLLAEAIEDLLPADFLGRPKMGFTLPFEKWMSSNLRQKISGAFGDRSQLERSGINPDQAGIIWERFLRRPKEIGWSRPWSLFVLVRWCEINQVSL